MTTATAATNGTRPPARIAFLAVGGALVVTGAVLVGLGYAKRNKARASARLEPAPAGLRVRF